jgi:peroxiredoxin
MVLTKSVMLDLGTAIPPFTLPSVTTGEALTVDKVKGEHGLLVMFICAHCPYVKHVQVELAKLGNEYHKKGLGVIAISSNDSETHPDDAPPKLKEMSDKLGFAFPFAFDESQDVAKAFKAACTPDFFLFDKNLTLVYRGQLDDSRPSNGVEPNGADLRKAIDAVLSGKKTSEEQKSSVGCNIKWKSGNQPSY